jgi:uncharacterized protein
MIRDATPDDFPQILALNAEAVRFLSPLTEARLRHLHGQAACHRVVELDGRVAGFLLALREGADYDSVNYLWFAERYPRFLYVDRVVVHADLRGQGLGCALYDDLISRAARDRIGLITCEFDVDPPNPASAAFHRRYGFREVGRQVAGGGQKEVSLQARRAGEPGAEPPQDGPGAEDDR